MQKNTLIDTVSKATLNISRLLIHISEENNLSYIKNRYGKYVQTCYEQKILKHSIEGIIEMYFFFYLFITFLYIKKKL